MKTKKGRLPQHVLTEINNQMEIAGVARTTVAKTSGIHVNTVENFLKGKYHNAIAHKTSLTLCTAFHTGHKVIAEKNLESIDELLKAETL